jgi:hypothetical protein
MKPDNATKLNRKFGGIEEKLEPKSARCYQRLLKVRLAGGCEMGFD